MTSSQLLADSDRGIVAAASIVALVIVVYRRAVAMVLAVALLTVVVVGLIVVARTVHELPSSAPCMAGGFGWCAPASPRPAGRM